MKDNEKTFIENFYKLNTPTITKYGLSSLTSRELLVTISCANYSNPSTVMIEIVGSPPKSRILMGLDETDNLFIVGNKPIPVKSYNKREKLRKMVLNFLKENDYLK